MISFALRWLLCIPSPSRMWLGPPNYTAIERRHVKRCRAAGVCPFAFMSGHDPECRGACGRRG